MEARHWIELGIAVVVILICAVTKYITWRKTKRIEGLIGINNQKPSLGYRLK